MRSARRIAWVALGVAVSAAGCGFRQLGNGDGGAGDGGGCGDPPAGLVACSMTKARGFEPLGDASSYSHGSSLAPAGLETAAVWEVAGSTAAAPGKLYFALIDVKGAVGNTKLLFDGGVDPVLLRVNDQLTLFWRQADTIYMQRLDDTGMLLNQVPATILSGTTDAFSVAWNGSEFGMVLSGANSDMYQVYWLRVSIDGLVVAGPTKLPQGGINSIQPALVWTGCEYAVAWTDTRPGTPAIYYARFAADFTRNSDDLMLSAAGMRGSYPTVAAQDTGGVVVCYEQLVTASNQEIFCARLDGSGVTNTQQLSSTPDPSQNPHAVAHGQNVWVLWDDYQPAASVPNVVWQFLDASGMPLLAAPRVDPDVNAGGWRGHGYYKESDALYFVQYYGDPQTNAFSAQIVTENCY